MKKLLYLVLVVGILCLAGCSEDEPQSVAFVVNEVEISNEYQQVKVPIEANCPWTITREQGLITIENPNGEGPGMVVITIPHNEELEEMVHSAAITSKDGTSKDVFVIRQWKSYLLDFGSLDLQPAEGGELVIDLETNMDFQKVSASNWIKFIESRSIQNHTLSFELEPNKTGSRRSGSISISDERESRQIEVEQDSYAPDKIIIEDLPVVSDTSYIECQVTIEPEYADWSKVKVQDEKDGTITLTPYHTLEMELQPGQNHVTLTAGEKWPFTWCVMYFPEIEFTPRLASCMLTTAQSEKKYLAHFDAHISDYPYLSIKHFYLIDKNGKVLLKDEGKTMFDKGMRFIETDALLFSYENYKEEIKGITFKVDLEFSYGEEYLESNILEKTVSVPDNW